MFEKYDEMANNQFLIEKQFKKDFGFTIADAERKIQAFKDKNREIYTLRCLLNGYDIESSSPIETNEEQRASIEKRLNELEQNY